MISEREFSSYFSTFWREILPNMDSVVRSLNLATRTEWAPIRSENDPARRDLIAETAFETAGARFEGDERDLGMIISATEHLCVEKLRRLSGFRLTSGTPLTASERAEIVDGQSRIFQFANFISRAEGLEFRPSYSGHGFVGGCTGDMGSRRRIIEIKYVDRNFRSSDYRQCLVYAVLRYFKSHIKIDEINVLNPFRGVVSEIFVDEIIDAAGGITFSEFLNAFSYYVSAGAISR